MSQIGTLQLATAAEIALRSLDEPERRRLEKALLKLAALPKDRVPSNIHKLSGVQGTYVLRATPRWRVVFRRDADTVIVLDIFDHERARRFQGR